ncbi:protein myomaker isoform X1 [Cuculus canorus]|uniref:protein myomaker isoform X1 n=1 Tax=Cuculus canorus TaxID=55661 RepID=UPI0023AAF7A6|nr:protein myomaker isoform X1 [Cuculus canorus]
MGSLVAKLLLPTISTLVFLPTISIAAKRRFHMEAMVYFFTMFFVAIFHACDGPGLSVLCFMRYDILEYFSIYGTALSIWVSLMALAEFDEPKRSTFVMFGVLTIAVRIYHDRWGYGVYSGPIGTAVLVITVKWLQKMKEKKGLYPDKSVYTQQIGPGFCFGALALMLRFFFEVPVCALEHSDFTRCKRCYQDRRPPSLHTAVLNPALGKTHLRCWSPGLACRGPMTGRRVPLFLSPSPIPLAVVWTGTDGTVRDV